MMADAIEVEIVRSKVQEAWDNQVASARYYYKYRGFVYDFIIIERVRSLLGS